MRSLRLVTLVLVVTLLASAQAAFAQPKQATDVGSGGAAATVDLLGTRGDRHAPRTAATPSTPPWRPRPCSA